MFKNARNLILTASTIFACSGLFAQATAPAKSNLNAIPDASKPTAQSTEISKEELTKASGAFGHFIGRNLKTPAIQFDIDAIVQGIRDGAAGKPAPMSDKDYEKLMSKVQEHALQTLSTQNLKAAEEFLTKNAKEQGIVVVQPGKLQYKIITPGTGATVEAHASPKINYVGEFIDGTAFGSSEEAGGPVTIPLDQTIQGFNLGIAGMKEGEKRRLFVHPDLGYGTSGHLPPNSLLIFDIEVVKADNSGHESQNNDDDDDDVEEDDLLILTPGGNKNDKK